jgi:hypothetical protein
MQYLFNNLTPASKDRILVRMRPPRPLRRHGRARPGSWLPVAAALLMSAALASASEDGGGRGAALTGTLRDQHGRPGGFEPSAGQPTVVFVVSAARLKRLRDWEAGLRRRFEGLRFLRVADVPPSRPPARYEDVAGRLRKHVPREVSVLVDMERVWATGFEIDSGQVNLLVFDAAGRLAGRLAGGPTPQRLAQAAELIAPLAPSLPAPEAPR